MGRRKVIYEVENMHVFGLREAAEDPMQAQGEHVNYTQKSLSHNQLTLLVNQASKIIGHKQMQLQDLFEGAITKKATQVYNDPTHPLQPSFKLLSSGRQLMVLLTKNRYRNSFVPSAVTILNIKKYLNMVMITVAFNAVLYFYDALWCTLYVYVFTLCARAEEKFPFHVNVMDNTVFLSSQKQNTLAVKH